MDACLVVGFLLFPQMHGGPHWGEKDGYFFNLTPRPLVFIPCRGVAHSSALDPRRDRCQTKHGAYVGVAQRASGEECQVTGGVLRSDGVAVVSWPCEQMACRKPIDENRGAKGEKKREGKSSDRADAVLQQKGKTCLVVLQPHNTPVQVAAEGKRVCL